MVNEKGYVRPTYDELLESRIEQARGLFGEDIDISNNSPLGKFIRLAVQDLADAYESQEIIYYSRFPNTATGHSLDRLMPFAGISRNPATPAEHLVWFHGTAGAEVPVGFLVGTVGDEEFYLVNSVTLGENGVASGIVQCTEAGIVGNVPNGSITEIVNPDVNVLRVEHAGIQQYGKEAETDEELRERFYSAIEGSGSGTMASIRGAVMRVNGVTGCLIAENPENEEDEEGRPPHSFEVYVKAPSTLDQEIGEAIFAKKPFGIKCVGDVAVSVTDVSGGVQTVYFSRVVETEIYILLTVVVDSLFESDGEDKVKEALVSHVNSLGTGEDVVYTRLYKCLYAVPGVVDVPMLTIGQYSDHFMNASIPIAQDSIANLSASNINLSVVRYEG